eukprot:jgi/Botrbrau1/3727/Bobra.0363s0012.1
MSDGKGDLSDTTPKGFPFVMPTISEPFDMSFVKAMLMELLATCLFLYTLTGSVVFGCTLSHSTTCTMDFPRMLTIAFTGGFGIFVFVYFAASFSGGHLNPAVSFGLLLSNKITVLRFFAYVPMQMLGAMLGSAIALSGNTYAFRRFGGAANGVSPDVPPVQAFGLEIMSTFILMFTVLGATDVKRYPNLNHLPALAPFAIGLAIFLGHLVLIPIDGCASTLQGHLGSAVVTGEWRDHWVFWAGPIVGAALASFVYEIVFRPDYEMLTTGHEEVVQNLANAPDMLRRRRSLTGFVRNLTGLRAAKPSTPFATTSRGGGAPSIAEHSGMAEP